MTAKQNNNFLNYFRILIRVLLNIYDSLYIIIDHTLAFSHFFSVNNFQLYWQTYFNGGNFFGSLNLVDKIKDLKCFGSLNTDEMVHKGNLQR